MKKHRGSGILICIFFILINHLTGQTPDVFRAEYMLMPKNSGDVETSRIKLLVNVPIPVRDKKDFLVLGSEYNSYNFEVPDELFPDADEIRRLHVVDVNFAYVYKLNEEWRLIGVIAPRWASNFIEELQQEDFNMNYTAGAFQDKKDIDRPFKLVLGVSYNATSPVRVPLPVLYYEKRFHPRWAYIVGVPKSGMKYFTPKEHFFQMELFLDGYYVNIQNDILLAGNSLSTDVSYTALLFTVGYQYKITKDMSFYLLGGHSLFQNSALRDIDRKDIFTLNDAAGLYFRTGFRIGI